MCHFFNCDLWIFSELNSSPQPCLVPFLKRSLPFLQNSLISGELTIEGVRPPPRTRPLTMTTSTLGGSGGMVRSVTTMVRPPVALPTRPVSQSVIRGTLGPNQLTQIRTPQTAVVTSNSVQNRIQTGIHPTQQTVGYFDLIIRKLLEIT